MLAYAFPATCLRNRKGGGYDVKRLLNASFLVLKVRQISCECKFRILDKFRPLIYHFTSKLYLIGHLLDTINF